MIHRRQFLAAGLAGTALTIGASRVAADGPIAPALPVIAGFAFTVMPGRVYRRSGDQNRLRHEHWMFALVLMAEQARKPVLERLVVTCAAAGNVVRETTYAGTALAAMDLVPSVAAAPERDAYPVAAFQIGDSLASALAVDRVHCALTWAADGGTQTLAHAFAIETYVQRTALVFPFRGHGLITQGGAWNDGHRNRSGMFAIDAIGLDADYAPMLGAGEAPAAHAGWGREVIAPAAGTIVVARGDRPDQPLTGVSDPRYFVAEFPDGGDPGNHVVIDHGNGEFSLLAHFRHGSLRVQVGERVVQRQGLGQLGNSGDTDTPHVHHQLQSGPQWTSADALPHSYNNGPAARHDRGVFFDAK